jgi:hypothetical protein
LVEIKDSAYDSEPATEEEFVIERIIYSPLNLVTAQKLFIQKSAPTPTQATCSIRMLDNQIFALAGGIWRMMGLLVVLRLLVLCNSPMARNAQIVRRSELYQVG